MRYILLLLVMLMPFLAYADVDPQPKANQVEVSVSESQPAMEDTSWHKLNFSNKGDTELQGISPIDTFWVRVWETGTSPRWVVYGPLNGENQELVIYTTEDKTIGEYVQFSSNIEDSRLKSVDGFKCCKVKVRIVIKTKVPKITVREKPSITIKWQHPIPSVTIKGPDIIVENLPRMPTIDSPIPVEGTPDVGMYCEVINNLAVMSIQNGESEPVDVSLVWKEVNLGPIRIRGNTMRTLPKTGYKTCEIANENIYITGAKFVSKW